MNINLCYVPGISRTDTLYFSSVQDQDQFFDNYSDVSISTTYYPPHYTNKIRFDLDDIEITSSLNYLWFEWNYKRYYYFIDDITYISESCIELSITMDTIQTFYFETRVTSGIIERKFINRYESYRVGASTRWRINRNYIRENVSEGLFKPSSKQYFDMNNCVLVIKTSEPLGTDEKWYDVNGEIDTTQHNVIWGKYYTVKSPINNTFSFSNCRFYFLPLFNGREAYQVQIGNTVLSYEPRSLVIDDILSEPSVVDAYLLPLEVFQPLFSVGTLPGGNKKIYLTDDVILRTFKHFQSYYCPLLELYNNKELVWENPEATQAIWDVILSIDFQNFSRRLEIDMEFYKQSSLNEPFDTSYMVQLYDENYINLTYGTPSTSALYPLFYMTTTDLYLYEMSSIVSYDRLYFVSYYYYPQGSEIAQLQMNNNYSEYIVDNSPNFIDFTNAPYKEYVAANRGRWASAVASTVISAAEMLVGVKTASMSRQTALDNILLNPRSRTPIRRQLKYGALRNIRNIESRYTQDLINEGSGFVSDASNNVVSQAIQDYNMSVKPKSVKQTGNSESMIMSLDCMPFYQLSYVIDYYQCAMYFHRNGFRVDEYVSNVDNIFQYVHTRYYFNVLKMSLVEIRLTNYINSDDIIQGIKDRLLDGIRLWRMDNGHIDIGNFEYDNVELAFIQ